MAPIGLPVFDQVNARVMHLGHDSAVPVNPAIRPIKISAMVTARHQNEVILVALSNRVAANLARLIRWRPVAEQVPRSHVARINLDVFRLWIFSHPCAPPPSFWHLPPRPAFPRTSEEAEVPKPLCRTPA